MEKLDKIVYEVDLSEAEWTVVNNYKPFCKYCKQNLDSCDCDSPFWRESNEA